MAKGLNLTNLKNINRSSVLYLLNKHKLISRKGIAEELGLTKAAVSKIVSSLISEGLIIEKEEVGSGIGRKEIMLGLNISNQNAFGINFDKDYLTLSVSSLDGTLIDSLHLSVSNDFKDIKNQISKYYDSVKNKYHLIGVGVAIVGQENDYGFFKNTNIKKELSEFIDLPIYLKNNVQAFSLAEIIYGNQIQKKNVLIFKWGPGIGSSFIKDEKVMSGDDNGITEIGHMIVTPNGKRCRCGRRGCLETEASLDVIVKEINAIGYNLSLDDIFYSNDKIVLGVLEKKIDVVSYALLNACTILNANHIVLFGSVFRHKGFLNRFLNKWVEISKPLQVSMDLSSLNEKSDYIGSVAVVARKMFFEK